MLHQIQRLAYDRAMFAPLWQYTFLNAVGPYASLALGCTLNVAACARRISGYARRASGSARQAEYASRAAVGRHLAAGPF
jgi:hypothetical protein